MKQAKKIDPLAALTLKTCPFCGGLAKLKVCVKQSPGRPWQALCADQRCRGGEALVQGHATSGAAAAAWNLRPQTEGAR